MAPRISLFLSGLSSLPGSIVLPAQSPDASLSGLVTDGLRSPLAGSALMAARNKTGLSCTIRTDEVGRFLFPPLPRGPCRGRLQLVRSASPVLVETAAASISVVADEAKILLLPLAICNIESLFVNHNEILTGAAVAASADVPAAGDPAAQWACCWSPHSGVEQFEFRPGLLRSQPKLLLVRRVAAGQAGASHPTGAPPPV